MEPLDRRIHLPPSLRKELHPLQEEVAWARGLSPEERLAVTAALCRDAMIWHATKSGFDVRFYPDRMTHMKALLVDGRTLVVGSANFDVLSYRFQQEFMAIVTDPHLVADFARRVVEEDLRLSARCRRVQGSIAARITGMRLEALDRASAWWRLALPPAPVPCG